MPAGDPTTVPGYMLRLVQRQLEELDLATFHAEWAPEARDRVPEGRAVDTTSRRGTGPRNA
ncbi:hypothetical protein [Modestobacter marinus]|uniref:hypothetical protein n=1 Tax=Modestobacter marinus TaxID=477641 RepID=UPI001C95F2E4|nr:hypothetical protein [Modestobacter marinus]